MPTTQAQLEQVYNNSVLAENPNLAPSLQAGQDLYFKRKGATQIVATATQELAGLENNIFPVSSISVLLYKHASNLGIPPISGALPSYGNISLVVPVGTLVSPVTFTILSGTLLTNAITSVQYTVTTTTVITIGTAFSTLVIPVQSVLSGASTYSPPNTNLDFATPYVLSPTVTISSALVTNNFVSGQNLPTDSQVSNVVYNFMQSPRGGGSDGDYQKWSYESSPLITNSSIIPAGGIDASQNFLLVAIMGGSSDPNVNIKLTYPISRQSSNETISICSSYIEGVRPVNDNPNVVTVSTFALSPTTPNYVTTGLLNPVINLRVSLADGLTLTTNITGSDGSVKTVREWILYQFRFAILSAPYKGVLYNGGTFILGENITTILSNGLANSQYLTGYLCSILVNATFTYTDANVTNILDIPVPNSNQFYLVGSPTTLNIIYDIDTTIINITVV